MIAPALISFSSRSRKHLQRRIPVPQVRKAAGVHRLFEEVPRVPKAAGAYRVFDVSSPGRKAAHTTLLALLVHSRVQADTLLAFEAE